MKKHVLPIILAFAMLMLLSGCSGLDNLGDKILGTSSTPEPIVISSYFDSAAAEAADNAAQKAARVELSAEQAASQLALSVVTVTACDGQGSEIASGTGFFTTGGIVTSLSTVLGAESVTVTLADTGVYKANGLHYYDQNMDLAVLACPKQDAPDLTASQWGTETGDVVFILGADGSASSGSLLSDGEIAGGYDSVTVSADINEANAGGPVVNVYGELVGACVYDPMGDGQSYVISAAALSCLDLSQTTPLSEVNAALNVAESVEGTRVITGDDGESVYSNVDMIELEPNDDALNASQLSEGLWAAGYVNLSGRDGVLEEKEGVELSEAELIADSLDIYSFTLDQAGTVDIYIKPYYSNDVDVLDGTWMMTEETEEESESGSEEESESTSEEESETAEEAPELIHLRDSSGDTGFFSAAEQDGYQCQHAQCSVEAGTYYIKVQLLDDWDYDAGCYYTISYSVNYDSGE